MEKWEQLYIEKRNKDYQWLIEEQKELEKEYNVKPNIKVELACPFSIYINDQLWTEDEDSEEIRNELQCLYKGVAVGKEMKV